MVTRSSPIWPAIFLPLKTLPGILALTGRTMCAVRDRSAVRGPAAAEIVPLHRTGKALADRSAGDVDELADDEMIGSDLSADIDEIVGRNAELGDLPLRLNVGAREMTAHRLAASA